jgi:serine/threonine-protein kinase
MPALPLDPLLQVLWDAGILESWQMGALGRDAETHAAQAEGFLEDLVRRGWLTPYQAPFLLEGRARELLLGSYVLMDKLGVGGMGEVYKARHRRLDRVVALKVIRPDRLERPDLVVRFQREARLAARLHHPNLVLVYDADEVDSKHFFTMEFIDGENAAQKVVRMGPLPVSLACDIVRQAALGLQHAHEKDLVHRDVKPSNLLVERETGIAKVLDLGLAFLGDAFASDEEFLTPSGQVMGTADYMAPEQGLDSHQIDIRADIYSLGCTLYHLLSGKPPFPGGTYVQKVLRHREQVPKAVEEWRPELPPALGAAIRCLMAKSRDDRPRQPAEVAGLLEPFCVPTTAPDGGESRPAGDVPTGPPRKRSISVPPGSSGSPLSPTPVLVPEKRHRNVRRRWLFAFAACTVLVMAVVGWRHWPVPTAVPPPPAPSPSRSLPWPDDYPVVRRERVDGVATPLIFLGPYRKWPLDPARGLPDGDGDRYQVEWHRRLSGTGRFQETAWDFNLFSDRQARGLGTTILTLDDDLARRWFDWEVEVRSNLPMQDPQFGLFFGWQVEGDRAGAYFVRLTDTPFGQPNPARPALHVGWLQVALADVDAGRWPAPLLDAQRGNVFQVFEGDEPRRTYKVRVRAEPASLTFSLDGKTFPAMSPRKDPRGPLGLWVQDGRARFGISTVATLPSPPEANTR